MTLLKQTTVLRATNCATRGTLLNFSNVSNQHVKSYGIVLQIIFCMTETKRKLVLLSVVFYCICGLLGYLYLKKEGIVVFQQTFTTPDTPGKGSIIRRQENNCVLPILTPFDKSISRLINQAQLPQCDPVTENVPTLATLLNGMLEAAPDGTKHCRSLEYREIQFYKGDKVLNKVNFFNYQVFT
jgi:hypothetical protein